MVDFDSLKADPIPEETQSAAPPAQVPFDQLQDDSQKYGTASEMAKTGLEQFASGLTFGLSKVLETKGIPGLVNPITTPEAIAGREAANPLIAFGTSALGTGALVAGTAGAGLIPEAAGAAGRIATGTAIGGGLGGVSQATDDWSQNKPLDAQKIAASAGLGALLGGAGSAIAEGIRYKLGTPLAKGADDAISEASQAPEGFEKPVISQIDAEGYKNGDFATSIENSPAIDPEDIPKIMDGINDQKPNAKEIIDSSNEIGAIPHPSMTSDNVYVQKATDALLTGPPTYSGIETNKQFQQIYSAVQKAANEAIGEGSPFTKAELGNNFKTSIIQQIEQQVAPINALYDEIKQYHSIIPLSDKSAPAIARNIGNIQGVRISPSSPEGQLANRVIKEIAGLKTVDDVKAYKSVLNGSISPTASSGEKRMAGIISDKLGNLEDSSIIRFAKSDAVPPELKPRINQLLDQRKAADAIYKPFRENLNTLAEQLGKGKTYGAQDAINFIQNKLTPEEVVQKLFSKKDSEFLKFFQKNFPDQMELMRQYQKGLIRDAASASKEGFNPTSVFKQVNKLEPEIQKSLFSSADLQKLRAAQTVSESIPKSFNPSHTNDTSAFRSFFESPTGALIGNARDLALHAYIKSAGGGIQGATTDALQGHVGKMSSGIEKGVKGMFTGAAAQPKKGK